MGNCFCKMQERVSVIGIGTFVKQPENGGVTGNFPVISHFLQCIPHQGVEPVYCFSQVHEKTDPGIFVPVVLQLMQEHVPHVRFAIVRNQVKGKIDTGPQTSCHYGGFQKGSAVNGKVFVNVKLV